MLTLSGTTHVKATGKNAVVAGASKGTGAGIAKELAAAGVAVGVNYGSDRTCAESVVDVIVAAGGRATSVQAVVAKAGDFIRLFEQTKETFGSLDILVNNAGVFRAMPVTELTEEEFHREIKINLLRPLLVIRESLMHFGQSGGSPAYQAAPQYRHRGADYCDLIVEGI